MKIHIKRFLSISLCWIAAGLLSYVWDWSIYPMMTTWQYWLAFAIIPIALCLAETNKSDKFSRVIKH